MDSRVSADIPDIPDLAVLAHLASQVILAIQHRASLVTPDLAVLEHLVSLDTLVIQHLVSPVTILIFACFKQGIAETMASTITTETEAHRNY